MSDVFAQIDTYATRTGRESIAVTPMNGRGLIFTDGCDVCWLLPGDVLTTLPAPTDADLVARTITNFERIDRIRTDVIHVIRHYLASKEYGVIRNRSGAWSIQSDGGLESSISVGAYLTSLIRDGADVMACLNHVFKYTIIRHPPSEKRAQRYLQISGDPSNERGFVDKTIHLGGGTIIGILKMMNLCSAAEALPDDPTVFDAERFVGRMTRPEPKGPIGAALLRMGERLPDAKAAFEIMENAISLDFDDGSDGLIIRPKSRDLARSIRSEGSQVVGERLADEFERLNRLRTVTLRALDRAAIARGWSIETSRTGVFNGTNVWHLGHTHRECTIDVGAGLTDLLRQLSPTDALRRLVAGNEISCECGHFIDAALSALDASGPVVTAPRGRLSPMPAEHPVPLASLEVPEAIGEMDAWASEVIAEFRNSQEALRRFGEPDFYDPDHDDWLTADDWVSMARAQPDDAWYRGRAIRILLEAGDPQADAEARRRIADAQLHHESLDDDIILAWRYRNDFVEAAKKDFFPQLNDDVPYAEQRARADDPIAQWYVKAGNVGDVAMIDPEDLPAGAERPDLREQTIEWARREWNLTRLESVPLTLALQRGWPEVADALDDNPHLAPALLTRAERGLDGFDSPGMLMADSLLLKWSRLKPTDLLARLLMTARQTDLVGEARTAERDAAKRNKRIEPDHVEMAVNAMGSWWEQMQLPMAIAWSRWRSTASDA